VEKTKERKYINRIIFAFVIVTSYMLMGKYAPIMPHIQLPAEPVIANPLFQFAGQDFYITNTMTTTFIAIFLLILLAWSIRKQLKRGDMILTGLAGVTSAILEGFYNMTESTAGKWARKIFPYFATIFLLVFVVNLMELLPGIDTIGVLREVEPGHHGFEVEEVWGLNTIVEVDESGDHHSDAQQFAFFPFFRVASTDLNFTLSLALISVVMTQVIGLRALGAGYLSKYWDGKGIVKAWKQKGFGNVMDFIISFVRWFASVLEIVAEFSKILSFTFRLFGVIFAGSVLLFFIGSMVGAFGQVLVLFLELLFGPLQAFVFGMLTMVFMSMATHSHGEHEEDAH
jgi:F-type H+-transporting ATPase subunit a